MPTIIDSLILTLELDPSQFTKAQKEAASALVKTKDEAVKGAKAMEDAGKKAADALRKIATEALAMFAVFTGSSSLKNFVNDLISVNTQLGYFADRIGVSPQSLQAWENAAERFGGSAEATAGSFQKIRDLLNNLKTFGQMLPPDFYRLMSDSGKTIDTDRGPVKFMSDLADAAQRLAQSNPQQAAFYLKNIGIDEGTINLILKGGPALDSYIKSLERLSPTPQQIKASQDLSRAWIVLEQTASSLGNTILPTLNNIMTPLLQSWAQWIDKNRELINTKVDEVLKRLIDTLQNANWPKILGNFNDIAIAAGNIAKAINGAVDAVKFLDRMDEASKKWLPSPSSVMDPLTNPFGLKPGETIFNRSDGGKALQGGGIAPGGNTSPSAVHRFPGRATGGSMDKFRTYLVGENGPELLNLGSSAGTISPNTARSGDLQVDGRTVNRSNPIPVQLANGGSGGENWLQTALSFLGLSGGGGGGGGGGGIMSVVSNTVRAITGGGGGGGSDAGAAARATSSPGVPLKGTSSELVAYIRESAIRHGIDPDVALRVARGEGGLLNPYRHGEGPAPRSQLKSLGPKENSYGPFQLYISGTGAGLGDRALKAGIDPRTNWKGGIDFALDEVRSKGWGQWYGARAAGITGMRGVGPLPANHAAPYKPSTFDGGARFAAAYHNTANDNRTTSTQSVTVNGGIHVTTAATDGKGTGAAVADALRRAQVAQTSNYGLK
ncbi:hypothetical protein LMIY3S_01798 [Labrys miyagiensis]